MKVLASALAAILAGAIVLPATGIRINATASMPRGLWLLHPVPPVYRPGDIVVACPPLTERQRVYFEPGQCPNGFEPVVKPVVAAAGDTVQISPLGVIINGRAVPDSAPLSTDGAGRPVQAYPSGTYLVGTGQVWLMSRVHGSFDSRYFGPVPIGTVRGTATPLWLWDRA